MQTDGARSPRKTFFSVAVLLLCLLTVVLLCAGALHVLLRQGQEVEVSVETSGEQFTESVTVTLRNVLGKDILIDEQEKSCAMLQRRVGETWEDVSEIRFVQEDSAALSAKYGGMYAHLSPGGELLYELDGEQINTLPGGEYRIAIRYISEKAYAEYLRARAREIETSLDAASRTDGSSPDPSADPSDSSSAPSGEESSTSAAEPPLESASSADSVVSDVSDASDASAVSDAEPAPSVLPKTELLYAEFVIIPRAPESAPAP